MTDYTNLIAHLKGLAEDTRYSVKDKALSDAADAIQSLLKERDEAVIAEREACAKIAENTVIGNADEDIFGPADLRARRIMRAIRSR